SAEAKTSPIAPCWICAASVDDPAKLNFTTVPGWIRWKSAPIAVKAVLSEDAANTVMVPLGADGLRLTAAVDAHAVEKPTVTARNTAVTTRTCTGASAPGQLDDHVRRLDHGDGADARGQAELVGRLPGDQRHQPMRAGLPL